jgi:hypothetical protein
LLLLNGSQKSVAQSKLQGANASSGTLERMIVDNGIVAMDVDLGGGPSTLRFSAAPDSFFTIVAFNNEMRAVEVGAQMKLVPDSSTVLPKALADSARDLVIERTESTAGFELIVRDSRTGFTFFNIEGHSYDYNAASHLLKIADGRLLISSDLAKLLGRSPSASAQAGTISAAATMYPIEVKKIVNGDVESATLPRLHHPDVGTTPGPDVIVGDMPSMVQSGSSGTQVGLAIATTSCNAGVVDLDWFQLPNNDHPVIPQNIYRMSSAANNNDRLEQIGQGWMKHAFTALTQNVCGFGCNGTGGSHLGSGCSDPYDTSLNGSQTGIGSRAWANPFTGFYPNTSNPDGQPTSRDHNGHTHTGTSHRVLVEQADLNTTLNPGAVYFGEAQYVTPHEYAWCQSHPGQCNMYNNVSYRQFNVTGTTSFTFSPAAATVRSRPAILAWTGATANQIEPAPGVDGIGFVAYKVTNPSAGVYHYEYAVYNENLDRAIQSFTVPLGCGVTISNIGFHAPLQPVAFANDGTQNDAGYSNTPWAVNQTTAAITWSCQTFAQNQNANAIRWGTMYNFRFDSNKPPQAGQATVGFFKTGSPIMTGIQSPTADPCNPLSITNVVSHKVHGSAGAFDINLPLSGEPGLESRNTGGNHTFIFSFSNNIMSGNATVTSGTGNVTSPPIVSGNTMTVELSGVTDVQQIAVTASNVMDTFGQTLPDTAVTANILAGDTTANKSVNSSDVIMTKQRVGAVIDATNFRTDVNASGTVNASDVTMVKGLVGDSLP